MRTATARIAHLKSAPVRPTTRRGTGALAISNFFVTGFLTTNALHPYLLAGDMNEDIAIPATGSQQPIQRLTNGTGLRLTTPLNPVNLARFTHSIQSSNGLTRRYDYIFPNPLLHAKPPERASLSQRPVESAAAHAEHQ